MKKIILLILSLFVGFALYAQERPAKYPVSLSYFSHALIQPGVKLGTQWDFKEWSTEKEGKKSTFTKTKTFFIAPQLGLFSLIGNRTNFLLNAELGYNRWKSKRNTFSAWSIGLGYLLQSQVNTLSVNLGDGSTGNENREWSSHFLPSLNYTFGQRIGRRLDWFSKLTYGMRLSTQRKSVSMLLVELGIRYYWTPKM